MPCIDCTARGGSHCKATRCLCSCHAAPDRVAQLLSSLWWAAWGFGGGAMFMRWWLS